MDELEFQDHPYEAQDKKTPSAPQEHTIEFSDFPPDAAEDDADESQNASNTSKPAPSIFSLAYYQQFFDVDAVDVGTRVLWSMLPNPKRNVLEHVIRPNPDFYGPFWVCATLTFCIAISGNVADFFKTSGKDFKWVYDYNKVPLAASAIFGYWLIIPVILWAILRWRGSLAGYTLTELVCVYGYSLAIFIPCSILWLIPSAAVQYILAVVCSLLSGATLIITLYPAVKNDGKQVMAIFMVIIVLLHALLAAGFVMYFFRFEKSAAAGLTAASANITAPAVANVSEVKKSGLPAHSSVTPEKGKKVDNSKSANATLSKSLSLPPDEVAHQPSLEQMSGTASNTSVTT